MAEIKSHGFGIHEFLPNTNDKKQDLNELFKKLADFDKEQAVKKNE